MGMPIDIMWPDDFCPACGEKLSTQEGFKTTHKAWVCQECGMLLTSPYINEDEKRFPGVVQICDKCGAILDNQPLFSDQMEEWRCLECGHKNCIENIDYNIISN